MFSTRIRITAAVAFVIALCGQINASLIHRDIFSISAEKISILSFLPAAIIVFMAIEKRQH
jgi:hypothetical protein